MLSGLCSFAQTNRIDCLKQALARSAGPEKRLSTLFVLCEEKSSLNPDTLLQYALVARNIALQHGDSTWITLSNYYVAYNLVSRSLTDSGLAIIDQQLSRLPPNGPNHKVYTDLLLLKAKAYNNISRTKESLDLLYPLLADAEKREDTLTLLNAMNMIIGAYVNLGQDRAALEWGHKALPLFPEYCFLDRIQFTNNSDQSGNRETQQPVFAICIWVSL